MSNFTNFAKSKTSYGAQWKPIENMRNLYLFKASSNPYPLPQEALDLYADTAEVVRDFRFGKLQMLSTNRHTGEETYYDLSRESGLMEGEVVNLTDLQFVELGRGAAPYSPEQKNWCVKIIEK